MFLTHKFCRIFIFLELRFLKIYAQILKNCPAKNKKLPIFAHRNKQNFMSTKLKAILLILVILIVDQVSKIFIKLNFAIGDYVEVFKWFQIYFIENPGMAFGMEFGGWGGKLFLTIFRIIAVGFLVCYLRSLTKKQVRTTYILTVALLLAGAAGNILDSVFYGVLFSESSYHQIASFLPEAGGYAPLFYGKVVDMFYFPIIKNAAGQTLFFSPVFNVADSAITIAIFLILIFFRKELNESLESKKDKNVEVSK